MKKILLFSSLAFALAWLILEFQPDPVFSPHPQSELSFRFKLDSTGEAGQGLKIKSSEFGEVSIKPMATNQWLLSVRNATAKLEINGADKESIILEMKSEWETPFLVTLLNPNMLASEVSARKNQLPPELNQILTNRRKNLARLMFLPKYTVQAFDGQCYYGSCRFQFSITQENSLSLNVKSLDETEMSADYLVEADDLGAEKIQFTEKNTIKNVFNITLNTLGEAQRIAHFGPAPSLFSLDSLKEKSSIALSTATAKELKIQAVNETKSLDIKKLISDTRSENRPIEELGLFHQTLKKVLLTRPDAVKLLVKELKKSKTKDPFYISSIAALIAVDSGETQDGLLDLIEYQLSKKGNLEAKSLVMALGQSAHPSPETVDYLIDKAYVSEARGDLKETAQLATGSIARATENQAASAKLIERPLRDLEEFVQGHSPSIPISNVLEVIGNSGSPSAFKNLKAIYQNNKDPQTQVAVLNALRYMPQKEAGKMLEERLGSQDQLVRAQAKQALALRCEQYPKYCR
jgi:hypothetical protein